MHGTGKKILRKILRDTRDLCAFNSIFGGEHAIVGRDKMNFVPTIDQPAQIMENMGTCPLGAGHNIESSVENVQH